jgi:hypothetical protein
VSLLGSSKEESNEVGVEIRNPHLGPANSFAAAIVLPWGIWTPASVLQPQEVVLERILANHTQGKMAAGGRLFLTTTHLRFIPHLFDRLFRRSDCAILRGNVVSASVVDQSSKDGPFAGGSRRRLKIQTRSGVELFVVNRVDDVAARVNAWTSERRRDN